MKKLCYFTGLAFMILIFSQCGVETEQNDKLSNRIIWHSVKGYDVPYPVLTDNF